MIKFIKELWLIYVERAKARKAVRLLTGQMWSVEFLVALMAKATQMSRQECHVVLRNSAGQEMVIYAGAPPQDNKILSVDRELDIRNGEVTLKAVLDAAEIKGML